MGGFVGGCAIGADRTVAGPRLSKPRRASPPPGSTSLAFCEDNGGTWEESVCTSTGTNAHHIDVKLSAKYPGDLLDNPTAGPPLKDFLQDFSRSSATQTMGSFGTAAPT